jgi:hypothetical protein
MAHMTMRMGTFYIRAADTVKPLPRGSGQGPHLAAADGHQRDDDRRDGDDQR